MTAHLSFKYVVLLIFIGCACYVHWRGNVRHSWARQIGDHSTFMAPFNSLMYMFSAVPTHEPYLDVNQFPDLKPVREQWEMIRDEGMKLFDEGYIKAAAGYNDIGFNSFFRTGWKRFYLKWYDDFLPSASQLCPRTAELLAGIPSIHAALFAILPPGGKLVLHRDPYAGSLRYHLGLVTPNSPDCRIVVDGKPYFWKDGEDVVFDETFMHYAENKTDVTRLVLFCDIERPLNNPIIRAFDRVFGRPLIRAAATQNVPGEHVGVLNHIFGVAYRVRLVGKRIKAWNRSVYYITKWMFFGGILYWIFA